MTMKTKRKATKRRALTLAEQTDRYEHATLCAAIRAMVRDAFEGDYESGNEFLAAVLVEHAELDDYPDHALDLVKDAIGQKQRWS
jgi:hypothetical protein